MASGDGTSGNLADRLAMVGAALVAVGLLATIITLLPLALGAEPLPAGFYAACFLAPLGLGVILVSLWLKARLRRARLRVLSQR